MRGTYYADGFCCGQLGCGGLFFRYDMNSGLYYDASLRAGKAKAEYNSADLSGYTGDNDNVTFNTNSSYLAGHLGIGKIQKISPKNTMDYYGKYFYSRTGSDSVTLSSGETYDFDAVTSNRLRLGARFTHNINDHSDFYTGLAYQYEFGGGATGHYKGFSTAEPSLKGSTGVFELGYQFRPGDTPMTIDVGLNGYFGKQRGVRFQAGMNWVF